MGIFIFGCIVLLVAAATWISTTHSDSLSEDLNTFATITVPKGTALQDLRFSGIKLIAATKGSIKSGSDAEKLQEEKELREASELYEKSLSHYEKLTNLANEPHDSVDELRTAGQELQDASTAIIALDPLEGKILEAEHFERSAQAYIKLLNRLLQDNAATVGDEHTLLLQQASSMRSFVVSAGVVVAVLILLVGFFLVPSIPLAGSKAETIAKK